MIIPKLKRRLGALLYHTVAKHLPPSYSSLKLGQTALRRFCGRWMLADCGKRVNIEKNATFSAKVTLVTIPESASMPKFMVLVTLAAV